MTKATGQAAQSETPTGQTSRSKVEDAKWLDLSSGEVDEILHEVDLFRDLSFSQMQRLAVCSHFYELRGGNTLLRVREDCRAVFVVLSGTLRVFLPRLNGERTVLNLVGRGEVLGEICLADKHGHSASVVTIEQCRLLRIERSVLLTIKEENPDFRVAWDELIVQRLRAISARQAYLASGDVAARVAGLLIEFAERYSGQGALVSVSGTGTASFPTPDTPISLPLRIVQDDVASIVGASRFRVNRYLRQLEEKGVIRWASNRRLVVLNFAGLQEELTLR